MSPYVSVLISTGTCLAAIAGLHLLGRAVSVSKETVEVLPYQSGWAPREHALSRFHARWYPLTLVFLAFDVEMLFMYPWAVVVAGMGPEAVIEMFAFLGVLVAGVIWAWREGAFRWV
ncbi:NADH-quinone oxidoreductase subunit A [Arthrobacter sp.]|uniref:NADH-quinone oxidoreductase subunit A n=1 Tax=Arthrobacter sp. TaxID=1667 RepID=UPI003A957B8A